MIVRDLEKTTEFKELLELKNSDPDTPTEGLIKDYLLRASSLRNLEDIEPVLTSIEFRTTARVKDLLEKKKTTTKELAQSRILNDAMISVRLKMYLETVSIEISELPSYSIKEFRDKLDFLCVCISGSVNTSLDSLSERELITAEELASARVNLNVVRNYPSVTEVLESLEFLGITFCIYREASLKIPIVSGMLIGELLMFLRKALGVSKAKLSRLSGVTRQHIMRLERNESVPRLDTFFKLVYSMGLKFFITVPSYHG